MASNLVMAVSCHIHIFLPLWGFFLEKDAEREKSYFLSSDSESSSTPPSWGVEPSIWSIKSIPTLPIFFLPLPNFSF